MTTPSGPLHDATRRAEADTLLSPRFYTTDFAAHGPHRRVARARQEWDQLMAEYEATTTSDHFQRTADFADEVRELPPATAQEFLDFLISSVTAEFSGCVLYNEIRKNVQQPRHQGS